jgi:hypothetical protein
MQQVFILTLTNHSILVCGLEYKSQWMHLNMRNTCVPYVSYLGR